jgi:hypothetical protein
VTSESRYADDLFEQIRQLTARVALLEAQLKQRPALTQASQGWRMTEMSIPSVGDGEIHIGANDGELFVTTPSGTKRLNQVNVPVARPQYPSSFDSPATIGGTPTAENYNDLRADAAMLQVCVRSVIDQGDDIGLWNP